nr:MAG TPA: hypothetical protein [Caudoviricetes sp.]
MKKFWLYILHSYPKHISYPEKRIFPVSLISFQLSHYYGAQEINIILSIPQYQLETSGIFSS